MVKSYEKLIIIIIVSTCIGTLLRFNLIANSITTSNNANTKDRLELIKEKGILTIASANERPFAYINPETNKLSGIDAEITIEIARRLGINNVTMQSFEFEDLLRVLNTNNDIDMIASEMYITEERQKQALFTNVWYIEPEAIITPKVTKFNFKEDLKNAVIGTKSGNVFEELVNKWKKEGLVKDVNTFVNNSELILAVASGEIDAAMLDSLSASYIVTTGKNLNLKILYPYEPEFKGDVAAAVRKSDTTLVDAINRELDDMKKDGTLSAIYKKYGIK